MKVHVWVKFEKTVPYVINLADDKDSQNKKSMTQRISEALNNMDPSEWEHDPNFYEVYGSGFSSFVANTRNFQVEILDKQTVLPIVIINGKAWYVDTRLKQLRNVKNPHEFIEFEEL